MADWEASMEWREKKLRRNEFLYMYSSVYEAGDYHKYQHNHSKLKKAEITCSIGSPQTPFELFYLGFVLFYAHIRSFAPANKYPD